MSEIIETFEVKLIRTKIPDGLKEYYPPDSDGHYLVEVKSGKPTKGGTLGIRFNPIRDLNTEGMGCQQAAWAKLRCIADAIDKHIEQENWNRKNINWKQWRGDGSGSKMVLVKTGPREEVFAP